MSSNDDALTLTDEDHVRRPTVQETYASKVRAAKLHIAQRAALEAMQRVDEGGSAAEGKAETDDIMTDISAEMSSAKFFRSSTSERSNASTDSFNQKNDGSRHFIENKKNAPEPIILEESGKDMSEKGSSVGSPKRKSEVEKEGKNINVVSQQELKRSRSEPKGLRLAVKANHRPLSSGKTAVLGLIRARSEAYRFSPAQDEDDESTQLHGEIQELARQNKELWTICDASRKGKAKPEHHTHIQICQGTMIDEAEEDQDEAAKGLICFETRYHTVRIEYAEITSVVALSIDKNTRPVQSMLPGLAKSIPNQFTDWIHVKEATSDGFILAYRISPSLYRLCGEEERVEILRGFKKHLISIKSSLKGTHDWLKKAETWNEHVKEQVEAFSSPDCTSDLVGRKGDRFTVRRTARSLENELNKAKPAEIEKVVTWEFDLT